MASMRIWSPLCSVCAGRELKCSLFLSQRYLESAQELVLHLLPGISQHKHKGVQTHPSPPSKVTFLLQEPSKVHVQQALSAEVVRMPVATQPRGFSAWFSTTPLSADLFSWHKFCVCWPDCWADTGAEPLVLLPLWVLNLQMLFRASHRHQSLFLPTRRHWLSTLPPNLMLSLTANAPPQRLSPFTYQWPSNWQYGAGRTTV